VRTAQYVFIIASSLLMFYPVFYAVFGAFSTGDRFTRAEWLPIHNTLNLELWLRSFRSLQGAYLITGARVGFYLVINTFVSVMGGYIFSKLRFPGRNKLFLVLLMGMVMPPILLIVPNFIQMAWWPLTGGNNWLGQGGHGLIGDWRILFAYGWVPPFGIFLLKQSFDSLPTEYEDAAKLDGAGLGTIIFGVYGPLLKPALAALTIITFLTVWNDYLFPQLTLSAHREWYPIALRVGGVSMRNAGGPGALIQFLMAMWPPAAVYLLLQRHFVQGLTASGLKG
jgi:multiple sugar transport system permease protein